jgi:F-type H+-transporting ATPase subunit b
MLEINVTLIIQIVNFLFLLFVLNIILYRPIRQIIARRDEETGALQKAIEDYQQRADETEQGIREGTVQARKEGFSVKEGLKVEGLEEEKGIIREASSTAEGQIGQARNELEGRTGEIRRALDEQVAGFSRELAEKILGRSVR